MSDSRAVDRADRPESLRDPVWRERAVIDGFRRRDPAILGMFFDAAFPYVHTLATRLTGSRDLAEDVTQDVFLKVYEAADRLDPARHPRPWITTITCNTCREARRRQRVRGTPSAESRVEEEHDPGPTPAEASERRERYRLLTRALGALDDELREVVLLRAYGEFSHERIAEILETTHAAVRKRFSRAIRRLGELLRGVDV